MAVSTADFYAYAQATGTEVPSSKKEQAKIAPAVHQWRRSQIKQQRQENQPDLGDVVAWTGLGTGALAAAFLRDPSRARQVRDKVGKLKQETLKLRDDLASKIQRDPSSGTNTSATIDTSAQVTPKENLQTLINKVQPSTQDAQTQQTRPSILEDYDQTKQRNIKGREILRQRQDPFSGAGLLKTSSGEYVSAENAIFTKLRNEGIPDFEARARVQAYAATENPSFLQASFNANTLPGKLPQFRELLGVKDIAVNENNQIISGKLINPTGEIPASLRDYANRGEEVYDSGIRKIESEGVPEGSFSVTSVPSSLNRSGTGFTARTPKTPTEAQSEIKDLQQRARLAQQEYGEQVQLARNEFSREWDVLAQEGQVQPRVINRVVQPEELNLVVLNEVVNEAGETIQPAITYGEKLLAQDPASYAKLSNGIPVELDAPYQLNKARDLAVLKQNAFNEKGDIINPQLIEQWEDTYNVSSQRLQALHNNVFKGLTADDTLVTSDLSLDNKLIKTLDGENITPDRGPGSQKGKQVGGMVTAPVPQEVYNLRFQFDVDNNRMNIVAPGEKQSRQINNIQRLTPELIIGKTTADVDEIVTQPMGLFKVLQHQGSLGKKYAAGAQQDVYWSQKETVQAPLQVERYSPSGEFIDEVQGKINRNEIKNTLQEIRTEAINENAAANMVRSQVPEGGLPRQQLSNLISQTSKRTGINPNIIVQRLKTGGEASTAYGDLGRRLQERLFNEKKIRLPVLDSFDSYDFIDNIIGSPRDQIVQKRAVTVDDTTKTVYPLGDKNPQQLKKLGLQDYNPKTRTRRYSSTTTDPSLSRVPKGEPTVNLIDQGKTRSSADRQYEQTGWNEWEKIYDNTNPRSVSNQGRVESGSNVPMGDIRTPEQIAATWNKKRQSQGLPADITIEDAQRYKEKGFLPTSGPGSWRKARYTSDLTIDPGKQEYVPIDQTVNKRVTEQVTARLLNQGKKPLSDTSGTGLALTYKYTPAQATNKAVTWTLRKPSANDLLTETVNELTDFRKGLQKPSPTTDRFNERQLQLNEQGVTGLATPSELWIQEANAPTRNMFTNIETPQYNTPVASSQTTLSPTAIEQAEFKGIDEYRRSSGRSSKRRNR